jgi:hypothetical protein
MATCGWQQPLQRILRNGACRGSCGWCSFFSPQAARVDDSPSPEAYRCDGEPPGPVPIGGNVVLGWRGLSL